MHSNRQIHMTLAVAFALALTAIVVPAASARTDSGAPPSQSGPAVLPNPDQQTAGADSAGRSSVPPTQSSPAVLPNPDQQTAATEATASRSVATVVRVTAPSSGFDWGDAGIGAAGALGLAMLGIGGVLVSSQRRARRTRRSSPAPS